MPEVFFSLGATELSGKAAMASRKAGRSALLTLTFLAAGEREDLWHPGYKHTGYHGILQLCMYYNIKFPSFLLSVEDASRWI